MNRNAFRQSAAVQEFLEWAGPLPWRTPEGGRTSVVVQDPADGCHALACGRLGSLTVELKIRSSRYVPGGVRGTVPFALLPLYYVWRAPGMVRGDIAEAGMLLRAVRADLRAAVKARDWLRAQSLCFDVLDWGGERDPATGARPALTALGRDLCAYLEGCARLMDLDHATVADNGSLAGVPHFKSMWVKIYSLMADTPIYDSRVAGAIATLVELWRIQCGRASQPLPPELTFPAVAGHAARTARSRYPRAASPRQLLYTGSSTPARWAGATVRLGWLLQELVQSRDWHLCHALEAALFMAGRDCSGIHGSSTDIMDKHVTKGLRDFGLIGRMGDRV